MSHIFKVNDIHLQWKNEFTIRKLLDEVKGNKDILKFQGHGLIVLVNGNILSVYDKYEYIIRKNDDIKLIQMVGGG